MKNLFPSIVSAQDAPVIIMRGEDPIMELNEILFRGSKSFVPDSYNSYKIGMAEKKHLYLSVGKKKEILFDGLSRILAVKHIGSDWEGEYGNELKGNLQLEKVAAEIRDRVK